MPTFVDELETIKKSIESHYKKGTILYTPQHSDFIRPDAIQIENILDKKFLFEAKNYVLFSKKVRDLIKDKTGYVIEENSLLNNMIIEPICNMFNNLASFIENMAISLRTGILMPDIELKYFLSLFLRGLTKVYGKYKVVLYMRSEGNQLYTSLSPLLSFTVKNKNLILKPSYMIFLTSDEKASPPHPEFVVITGEKTQINGQECYKFIVDCDYTSSINSSTGVPLTNGITSWHENIKAGDEIECKELPNLLNGFVVSTPFLLNNGNIESIINNLCIFSEESLTNFLKVVTNNAVKSVSIYYWDENNLLKKYFDQDGPTIIIYLDGANEHQYYEVQPFNGNRVVRIGPFLRLDPLNGGMGIIEKTIPNTIPRLDFYCVNRSNIKPPANADQEQAFIEYFTNKFDISKTFCNLVVLDLTYTEQYNTSDSNNIPFSPTRNYYFINKLDLLLNALLEKSKVKNRLVIYSII